MFHVKPRAGHGSRPLEPDGVLEAINAAGHEIGCPCFGTALNSSAGPKLLALCAALSASSSIGLTSYHSTREVLEGLIVPAVAALRWLDVELPLNVVEIGAGNAALGLTLAALAPQWRVTLVDRREKAVAFMEIAALQMGLHNVVPLRADAREPGSGAGRVDAALFRAVGTPAEDLDMAAAWLKPGGSCLIWTSADLPLPPDDAVWCHLGTVAVLDGRMAVLAYAKT